MSEDRGPRTPLWLVFQEPAPGESEETQKKHLTFVSTLPILDAGAEQNRFQYWISKPLPLETRSAPSEPLFEGRGFFFLHGDSRDLHPADLAPPQRRLLCSPRGQGTYTRTSENKCARFPTTLPRRDWQCPHSLANRRTYEIVTRMRKCLVCIYRVCQKSPRSGSGNRLPG